jgi:hypothetical protein
MKWYGVEAPPVLHNYAFMNARFIGTVYEFPADISRSELTLSRPAVY